MKMDFEKENLGKHFKVVWFSIQGGRVYVSASAAKEVEKTESLPRSGRIDPIGNDNYVLWVSEMEEENYFLDHVSREIAWRHLADEQVQDCGKLTLPKGDAIFYYKDKNLPVICKEPCITNRGVENEYLLYGRGVFMDITPRTLKAMLNCPDIVWTAQCKADEIEAEEDYNFGFFWLPVREGKRLYLSNLYPPDMEKLPPVGVIRELEGGDYVSYPFEGRENYDFPYKYYQYRSNGLTSILSPEQPEQECEMIVLGGEYGLLNTRLFISSSLPFVVIQNDCNEDKYFLFKGETLDFSTDVFKLISEHRSILEECSNRTFDALIHRPDILLSTDE